MKRIIGTEWPNAELSRRLRRLTAHITKHAAQPVGLNDGLGFLGERSRI